MLDIYILLVLLIFLINLAPFFMPPTWIFLVFFFITFHLDIIPVVIIGAVMATLGRICLALSARNLFRPYLSKKIRKNYEAMGIFFNKKRQVTIPLMLGYAFLPIPSNQIYIAAGLSHIKIRLIATCFFLGRLLSYTFWIIAGNFGYNLYVMRTQQADLNIYDIFLKHLSNSKSILLELAGVGLLIIISYVPWNKYLKI